MPKPVPFDVSIVIPYAESTRSTLARVRSVLRHGPAKAEVLIVGIDTPARDRTKLEHFAAARPNVRLLDYEPVSIAEAYNRAARKASATCLLFLTPDIIFPKHGAGLVEIMRKEALGKGIGAVGCLLLDKHRSRIRHAGISKPAEQPFIPLYESHMLKNAIRKLGTRTYPYDVRRRRQVLAVAGALLISRANFRTLSGFKEQAGPHINQCFIELCLRAHILGLKNRYTPQGHLTALNPLADLQPTGQALAALKRPPEDTFLPDAPRAMAATNPLRRLFRRRRKT